MKAGHVVLTTSFKDRSDTGKRPAMTTGWKVQPGHLMMCLSLGTVAVGAEVHLGEEAKRRLARLGFIDSSDRAAVEAALHDLNKEAEQAKE